MECWLYRTSQVTHSNLVMSKKCAQLGPITKVGPNCNQRSPHHHKFQCLNRSAADSLHKISTGRRGRSVLQTAIPGQRQAGPARRRPPLLDRASQYIDDAHLSRHFVRRRLESPIYGGSRPHRSADNKSVVSMKEFPVLIKAILFLSFDHYDIRTRGLQPLVLGKVETVGCSLSSTQTQRPPLIRHSSRQF